MCYNMSELLTSYDSMVKDITMFRPEVVVASKWCKAHNFNMSGKILTSFPKSRNSYFPANHKLACVYIFFFLCF